MNVAKTAFYFLCMQLPVTGQQEMPSIIIIMFQVLPQIAKLATLYPVLSAFLMALLMAKSMNGSDGVSNRSVMRPYLNMVMTDAATTNI